MAQKSFAVFQILIALAIAASVALLALPHTAEAALTRTQRIVTRAGDVNWATDFTTSAFTPSNNSLLVVVFTMFNVSSPPEDSVSVSSTGGLSWTKRATSGNNGSYVTQIWTAPVTTGASITVTIADADNGTGDVVVHIYDYTGYNTSSPIGATASLNATQSGTLTAAPVLTSEVLGGMGDDCSTSIDPGASGGFTELNQYLSGCGPADNASFQTQYRTNSISTTIDWDVGFSGGGEAGAAAAAVEVKAGSSRSALAKPPNNLGLVGYWSFNEGTSTQATDFSGNGNTGTLTNAGGVLPTWTNGKRGKALDFDGAGSYVSFSGTPVTSAVKTISAWIYPRTNGEVNLGMIVSTDSNNTDGIQLNLCSNDASECPSTPNTLEFYQYFTSTDGIWNAGSNAITLNAWNHVVVTYDNSSTSNDPTFYINGWQISPTEVSTPNGTKEDDAVFTIGTLGASLGGFVFDGRMDDVRIYNRALGASEVAKLYAGGTSGAARANASSVTLQNGTTLGPSGGLVGHWTFDGADIAGVVYDRSGQNNNGYFIGGATSSAKTIGKLGQALRFDDVDDMVELTSSPVGANTRTVCAWAKQSTAGTFDAIMGAESGFIFSLSDLFGSNTAVVTNDGGATTVSSATVPNFLNTWHHYCAVRTSAATNNTTIYVDGALSGSANQSAGTPTAAGSEFIGNRNSNGYAFNGILDDVRVYSRALTAAEVKQLYKLGTATVRQ